MDPAFELLCLTLSSPSTVFASWKELELDEHDGTSLLGKHSMILIESLTTFTTLAERRKSTLLFVMKNIKTDAF